MVLKHMAIKCLNFNVEAEWALLRKATKPTAHRCDPKACKEWLIFTSKNDYRMA